MTRNTAHFSKNSDERSTPQALFDQLNAEFGPFDCDVCATTKNAKCANFNWKDGRDGLKQEWTGRNWMNPPYGKEIGHWVKKAYESSLEGARVCCLLPARTDTAWWHNYCTKGFVRFLRGTVKFKGHAPFPCAVVVFGVQNASPEIELADDQRAIARYLDTAERPNLDGINVLKVIDDMECEIQECESNNLLNLAQTERDAVTCLQFLLWQRHHQK